MSTVLDRAEQTRQKIGPGVLDQLESKPLSRVLRRETWSDHERAQYSDFEVALVRGTISREAYRDLLAQVYFVYEALENRNEELRNDPIAGPVILDELNRKEAVESDLVFFWGPDWRDKIDLLPVTKEYVERIRNATPAQFVAHHYNRYLADLSGGLMIDEGLKKAWDLSEEGRRYYIFEGIDSATEFKNAYRGALDELPVSPEEKLEIIIEAIAAYEYNIEMANDLTERHGVKAS